MPTTSPTCRKTKAASTVQNLKQQLRHSYMDLTKRQYDDEASRNGQLHLVAELRDREQAHQEALSLSLVCPKKWKN